MKRLMYMAMAAVTAMVFFSCDDDVSSIGTSLTDEGDKLDIKPITFDVKTRTVVADSVFTLSSKCYFGRVHDVETHTDVKSEFTTQLHILETMYIPSDEYILGRSIYNGKAAADSCELLLYLSKPLDTEDSLQAMKMQVSEFAEPIEEGRHYYSNFNPRAKGLLRPGGLSMSKMFTYANLMYTDSERAKSAYAQNIRIKLDAPYTDKNGATYDNYGTYIMQMYHEHPEYFRNSYTFTHKVCPGLFFEITDGMGFHSQVSNLGLRVHYRMNMDDTEYANYFTLGGTQEVLQTTLVSNDKAALESLAKDSTKCTYLKSPAGLFTEVELPVEEIRAGRESDSLLAAKITFQRINNMSFDKRLFSATSTILMIPADSLNTFFEKAKKADGKTAFLATFNNGGTQNVYTFTNISNLITSMWNSCKEGVSTNANWMAEHPNWNKVLLVPVTSSASGVEHDMSLSSTRLVGGKDNPFDPVQISVVYAKFTEK